MNSKNYYSNTRNQLKQEKERIEIFKTIKQKPTVVDDDFYDDKQNYSNRKKIQQEIQDQEIPSTIQILSFTHKNLSADKPKCQTQIFLINPQKQDSLKNPAKIPKQPLKKLTSQSQDLLKLQINQKIDGKEKEIKSNILLIKQQKKQIQMIINKKKQWMSPLSLFILTNDAIKQQLNKNSVKIQVTNSKSLFTHYLSLDTPNKLILKQHNTDIDVMSFGQTSFLCRYRTQPDYLVNSQKLKSWKGSCNRGKKNKCQLQNNCKIYYLPPPQEFIKSLQAMLRQLINQKWSGKYVGFFMPHSQDRQYFFLQILNSINQLYYTEKQLILRFQFILFQTDSKQKFIEIINKTQNHELSSFCNKWYYLQNGFQNPYKFQTSAYIEKVYQQQVILSTNMINHSNLLDLTHQIQVNTGQIRKKNSQNKKTIAMISLSKDNNFLFQDCQGYQKKFPRQQKNHSALIQLKQNLRKQIKQEKSYQQQINRIKANHIKQQQCPHKLLFCLKKKEDFDQQLNSIQKPANKKQKWVEIKILLYSLNKKTKQQINLFTGKKRKIQSKYFSRPAFIEEKQKYFTQIQLTYPKEKQQTINEFILKLLIQKKSAFQRLYQGNSMIIRRNNIQYPKYWKSNIANKNLQLFDVDVNSQEYKFINQKFKITTKFKAQRIQNKVLYQRYHAQKTILQEEYGQKIKEQFLFHGTGANSPDKIYNDNYTSYNINFSQENGYRGKGIYFAKQAKYSDSYCHKVGLEQRIMLLNIVLVGHSQKIDKKVSIRQTSYRDHNKKWRYQSVFSNYDGSDIYVVYLNNRAYPLYVITYKK